MLDLVIEGAWSSIIIPSISRRVNGVLSIRFRSLSLYIYILREVVLKKSATGQNPRGEKMLKKRVAAGCSAPNLSEKMDLDRAPERPKFLAKNINNSKGNKNAKNNF